MDDSPRNVFITLPASLHTFHRSATAAMVIAAGFWRVFRQNIFMTDALLWKCLQDANHQTRNEPGTSIEDSLICLASWPNPPYCVRTFLHNDGRVNAALVFDAPNLQRGEFMVIRDIHCEGATCGLLPLCSTRTWILYEPCAISGARWRAFHHWAACVDQIRIGLSEAGSSGYLVFTVMTTGNPLYP